MRTFFGIVIILLASSSLWLTYLWVSTRKDEVQEKPPVDEEKSVKRKLEESEVLS